MGVGSMTVFANGLEVSAKKQGCKVIAAFPDTCFTPPQTPATPPGVPVPYPNFGTDGDLASGSGTVKIDGGEVSQENSSKFSKVTGDEAGSAPKKGIITSNKGGGAYAKKWSMDVKVEGKGVVRFSDLATTNHSSDPGDDAPWVITATMNRGTGPDEAEHPGQTCTNETLAGKTQAIEDAKDVQQHPVLGKKKGTPSEDGLARWLKKKKNAGKGGEVCRKLRANRDRMKTLIEARENREEACFQEKPGEHGPRTRKKATHMKEIEDCKENLGKLDALIKRFC